jgi:hypothetical protein
MLLRGVRDRAVQEKQHRLTTDERSDRSNGWSNKRDGPAEPPRAPKENGLAPKKNSAKAKKSKVKVRDIEPKKNPKGGSLSRERVG